jgi:hypothetical protein
MWTAENRPRYNRDKLRFPSDLADEEWAHIEPLIPQGKRGYLSCFPWQSRPYWLDCREASSFARGRNSPCWQGAVVVSCSMWSRQNLMGS